jgi:cell division protein ZapE
MSASISVQYAARVAAGKIERDSAQEAVVAALARLEMRIAEHRLARKSSSLGWLFGPRARESRARSRASTSTARSAAARPCDGSVLRRRHRSRASGRVHFHEFMTEVHERIYALAAEAKLGEPTARIRSPLTAAAIAQETGSCASTNSTSPTSPTP